MDRDLQQAIAQSLTSEFAAAGQIKHSSSSEPGDNPLFLPRVPRVSTSVPVVVTVAAAPAPAVVVSTATLAVTNPAPVAQTPAVPQLSNTGQAQSDQPTTTRRSLLGSPSAVIDASTAHSLHTHTSGLGLLKGSMPVDFLPGGGITGMLQEAQEAGWKDRVQTTTRCHRSNQPCLLHLQLQSLLQRHQHRTHPLCSPYHQAYCQLKLCLMSPVR